MKEGQKRKYLVFKWLQKNYWPSLLVCLIVFVLGGSSFAYGAPNLTVSDFLSRSFDARSQISNLIFLVAFLLLISGPISTGSAKFFLSSLEGKGSIKEIFFAFKPELYWKVVCIEAVRYLLFLALPITIVLLRIFMIGINQGALFPLICAGVAMIFYYIYRFPTYILVQNPKMAFKDIFEKSSHLTVNKRWELFFIDLSFVCLLVAATLFFGIGGLLILPYYEGLIAQYYLDCEQLTEELQETSNHSYTQALTLQRISTEVLKEIPDVDAVGGGLDE